MRQSQEYWDNIRGFGIGVHAYRTRKGYRMTRHEVGAFCGVSHITIGNIERGVALPSEEVFGYLAECFSWTEQTKKEMRACLPAKLRAKRGAKKGKRDDIVERWKAGRRVFVQILDRWRAEAELTKNKLAAAADISVVMMNQIYNLNYAIPRTGVCRRLAKACGKRPTRLLLLRLISDADPALRRSLVKIFLPKEKELLKEMIREEAHGVKPIDLEIEVYR
jgi:transcriptional regulator with XRE-family HTH domain